MSFILASKSPRRIEILKKNKIKFKIIPARIKEETDFKKPNLIVMNLARKKALYVASRNPDKPVIAADTIVYCKGKIIGKPKNKDNAMRFLKTQSGKWQRVYTGVCLMWLDKNIEICDWEVSQCYMRKLKDDEIKEIASKHLDKAGGWAVQDGKDMLIAKIKGRYDNVVGLPLNIVKKFIKIIERANK
jgi:septum formation protein